MNEAEPTEARADDSPGVLGLAAEAAWCADASAPPESKWSTARVAGEFGARGYYATAAAALEWPEGSPEEIAGLAFVRAYGEAISREALSGWARSARAALAVARAYHAGRVDGAHDGGAAW